VRTPPASCPYGNPTRRITQIQRYNLLAGTMFCKISHRESQQADQATRVRLPRSLRNQTANGIMMPHAHLFKGRTTPIPYEGATTSFTYPREAEYAGLRKRDSDGIIRQSSPLGSFGTDPPRISERLEGDSRKTSVSAGVARDTLVSCHCGLCTFFFAPQGAV